MEFIAPTVEQGLIYLNIKSSTSKKLREIRKKQQNKIPDFLWLN
jgi:hypothetical protein